jgi:pimeloyl-ACP methyl ester carboxylesterase
LRQAERRFAARPTLRVSLAVLALAAGSATVLGSPPDRTQRAAAAVPGSVELSGGAVRVLKIRYRAHNGARRFAYVRLPAWYGTGDAPPIPLIISPHGRGLSGRQNTALWGGLPALGEFAVVSPDGQGRRLPRHSWGFAGQIDDLASMPRIVRRALPWLRVDARRIYAFGGSMGGQETLLLVARYPRLLAGAAAFDSVSDLARQYRAFPRVPCNRRCRKRWTGPMGIGLQSLARVEIGGGPRAAPRAYAARSPSAHAREIAFSCVPLQLWWSLNDRVIAQRRQSGRLFWRLRRLNPDAPVQGFVGFWQHSAEMTARARLPVALEAFGLMPPVPARRAGLRAVAPPESSGECVSAEWTPVSG